MVHATLEKFGYPDTLIHEYEHWTVQLRPKQATLGALMLICKSDAPAFSIVEVNAFTELQKVIGHIEQTLKKTFSNEKLNYLMLMMIDPHVHFHVLPRYGHEKKFAGISFTDPAWPGPPDLSHDNQLDKKSRTVLLETLRGTWPA